MILTAAEQMTASDVAGAVCAGLFVGALLGFMFYFLYKEQQRLKRESDRRIRFMDLMEEYVRFKMNQDK